MSFSGYWSKDSVHRPLRSIVDTSVELTGAQSWSGRIGRLLWWLLPVLFLLWLGRYGLRCWFIQDDFAWLGLLRQVGESRSLLNALFSPEAQGTIRPWSERGFFLLFESLFGLDSLPFRICVFTTMAANVVLLAWIVRRITGSRIAGFFAPVLWVANSDLATVLSWSSAYNEALCVFFLLSALALFIRFAETGRPVFWWCQLVVFTLGFGALEVNVVYPALAAVYAIFIARMDRKKLLFSLSPLIAISIGYFVLHRAAVAFPSDGPYALHLDGRIFRTLYTYWKWSLVPKSWPGRLLRLKPAFYWIATIAMAAFFVRETAKRRYIALFGVFWFLISLAPMLPIPEHITDYYLTIPLIGLAVVGAWGVACAWRSPWQWRVAALLLVAAYLRVTVLSSLAGSHWWFDRSNQVRALVMGADAAHRAHPDKTIVLDGVTSALYDDAVGPSGFYPLGLDNIYLTPGARERIHPSVTSELLPRMVLEPAVMRHAIAREEVVVYSIVGDHLRNITEAYGQSGREQSSLGKLHQEPRRVEVGNPLFAYLLGPEWFRVESGVRWMPRRATVRLGGPVSAKDKLLLEGFCPDQQLKAGPLHLSVSVDGIPLEGAQIENTESSFRRLFVMPPSLIGRDSVEIAISVDRTLRGPDGRELGLLFGAIAIEPPANQ
jgi:hypothetical protein